MPISNYGREIVATRLGSQTDNMGSGYLAIGSGSGTIGVQTTGLFHYFDRNQRSTISFTTAQEMDLVFDFSATEMSGLTLRQFGAFVESSGGKAWQVENVTPTLFTSLEELEVEIVWRVF